MKDFLEKNSSEVLNMLFTEFDINTAKKIWKEEAKEEGREEGRKEGRKEEKFKLAQNLINVLNISDISTISKVTGLSYDEIEKLL